MNRPVPSAAERTRQILEDLEGVRENLLALSDDIWLSIDHNDSAGAGRGCPVQTGLQREDGFIRSACG